MRAFGMLTSLVLIGVVMAGCVGSEDDPSAQSADAEPAGPASFDEDTGGIEGIVIDDEQLPVALAQVGVLGTELTAFSDESGRFSLSNVPPGSQQLVVQKLGYKSGSVRVDVAVGAISQVQVELKPIVLHTPYSQSWGEDGYFECAWQVVIANGPCGFPVVGSNVYNQIWTNNKRDFYYNIDAGSYSVFNELTWSQGTAATGDQMRVTFSYLNRTTSHWYCSGEGPSPAVFRWDRTLEDGEPVDDEQGSCEGDTHQLPGDEPPAIPLEGQYMRSFVSTGDSDVSPLIGLALQQRFEVYISIFYWEFAPDGYSALPDS